MSIFKSSFQSFVTKQIKLREAIVSQGNNIGGGIIGNRNKLTKNTLKQLGLPENTPINSFFTYTTSRQCVIRMSSGVNLKEDATILADNKFELLRDLVGPGLATRYVLEGGIPVKNVDFIAREKDSSGNMKEIKRDYTKYKHSTRGLHLKKGSFGKHYSATYGDPYIRSDAGDGYGIVPMPGITDATIRTKTAYGSLREAKVEFVVHNKRQLEIMELLYMRPGFPILLEWGWTMYIGNDGKKETYFPQIPDFWKEGSKTDLINKKIMKNKALTSGNYDGFLGMCKNFEFRARKDGGFECTTEIIGQGEIIESLKGKREGRTKTVKEGEVLERIEVDDFEYWLYALKLWCDQNSNRAGKPPEDYIGDNPESIDLYGSLLEFTIQIMDKANSKSPLNLDLDEYKKAVEEAQANIYNELASTISGYKEDNTSAQNKRLVQDSMSLQSWSSGATDLKLDEFLRTTEGLAEDFKTIEKYLDEFLIYKAESLHQDNNNAIAGTNYVRWDFLVEILNKNVIDQVGDQENSSDPNKQTLAKLTTRGFPDREPLLYTKYEFKNVKTQTFKVTDDTGKSVNADITQLVDMSADPNIALLPHQIQKINNAELLQFEDDDKVKREIGRIFISLDYLNKTYTGMRYNEDGLNPDFSMFKFLKKVWDGISNSCANLHKFVLQTEHERPDHIRVIDLGFSNLDVDPNNLHVLKVQSNETIVRDFNFNSTIPNAMSSTIAIAAQNPDSISDLEATSFAALHTNIETRFFKPASVISDKTKEKKAAKYDNDVAKFKRNLSNLYTYKIKMLQGKFQEDDAEGDGTETNTISKNKALATIKALEGNIISLCSRYPQDDEDGEYFKGFRRKFFNQSKSEIIPLKFNAQLDGISGIIIGNVFKIDKTRLPEGYQGEDIAFVVMGENQKITAGQDWVTEISGQIMLLDIGNNVGQIDEIDFGDVVYQVEITRGGADNAGFDPEGDQARTVPGLLELEDGDPLYLKIGDGPTFVRHNHDSKDNSGDDLITKGEMLDNESGRGNKDNVIGCFPGGGFYDQNKLDQLYNSVLNANPKLIDENGVSSATGVIGEDFNLFPDNPAADYFIEHVTAGDITVDDPSDVDDFQFYNFEGEQSLDFITEYLTNSEGENIVAPNKNSFDLLNLEPESQLYRQLQQVLERSKIDGSSNYFIQPGKPIKGYRQSYKGLHLGWKRAERVETRFANKPNEYQALWFQIEFTKEAWQIVNAFPWVIDGAVKPAEFLYYEAPNDHIRVRHGLKLPPPPTPQLVNGAGLAVDDSDVVGQLVPITVEDGNVTDFSDANGVFVNSYMSPDDPRFKTVVVINPVQLTSLDKDGANRGPEFEADGSVGNDPCSTAWYDESSNTGGIGWMEASVLDVAINEEQFKTDRDSFNAKKLKPAVEFRPETTVDELISAGLSGPAIDILKAITWGSTAGSNGKFGYNYYGTGPLSSRREFTINDPTQLPYYPWWCRYKANTITSDKPRASKNWNFGHDHTKNGHMYQGVVDIVNAAGDSNNVKAQERFCFIMMKLFMNAQVVKGQSLGTVYGIYFDQFDQDGSEGNVNWAYKYNDTKGFNVFGQEINNTDIKELLGVTTTDYSEALDPTNSPFAQYLLGPIRGAMQQTEFRKMTMLEVHLWHHLAWEINRNFIRGVSKYKHFGLENFRTGYTGLIFPYNPG